MLIFFTGCLKDTFDKPSNIGKEVEERGGTSEKSNSFLLNDEILGKDTLPKLTILGRTRNNPFTVQNMKSAYFNLYGVNKNLPVTEKYIKFTPTSLDQLKKLALSDIELSDYPFEKEVLVQGDYYKEPGTANGTLPVLYAVVKPDQVLPNVPYTVISELHISSDINLTKRGFLNVGEDTTGIVGKFPPLDEDEGGGGGGTPTTETGVCGCTVNSTSNQRRPSGCVEVWDEQKSAYVGVKRVKVFLSDGWFTQSATWTDDFGCFRLQNEWYGTPRLYVRFSSERVNIRQAFTVSSFTGFFYWMRPIGTFVGYVSGPVFNNIHVQFDQWTEENSPAHRNFGAATINNAVHDFHEYAAQDGINTPPNHLDVMIGLGSNFGFALMNAQNELATPIVNLIQSNSLISENTALSSIISFFSGAFAGSTVTKGYLPDVFIGANWQNSDRIKHLAYHEIAHASHFTHAGEDFWNTLAAAEILADGHGTPTSPNAGVMAIAESWAEHIGMTYAHRNYGANNTAVSGNSWLQNLDWTRNETLNHIPIGLYHDLSDNTPDVVNACDEDFNSCGPINDQVSGITQAQMFNLLDGTTISPAIFRDKLMQGLPANAQNQINLLFNSY